MGPISKSTFTRFLDMFPVGKVVKKISNTERSQWLWPSHTSNNDQKCNFWADKGSVLPDGRQEIIFQANKNAENKGVRKSAQSDSHKIVSKVAIDPKKEVKDIDIMKDALKSFDGNN